MANLSGKSNVEEVVRNLNEVQQQAVAHVSGPLVIFAGAGSGKTRVITTRIAKLIEEGVRPGSILAVTFTNKAAKEMKDRVVALSASAHLAHIATFHSACTRWLREFAHHAGFSPDFTIYDDNDSVSALKTILKELKVDLQEHSAPEYKAAIGKAKTYGWLPADVESSGRYAAIFPPFGAQVYRRYQEYLAGCNAMDFNDLLTNLLLLLRNNQDVRSTLQKRYKHVLVDEYQDTNPTQFAIINLIVNEQRNLFVVGDDDQSIYSWRGADPSNILNFTRHFPGAREIRLEQNYRCAGNIVAAANAVVANNKHRASKKLWTQNAPGALIAYNAQPDGETEAWFVVEQIKSERHTFNYDDVAVFYRTNAQSRLFEDHLRKNQIPYRIYGSLRFYDRAEIKDVLAYFRLIYNKNDDIAFKRIANVPTRGFGKKALDSLQVESFRSGVSLFETAQRLCETNDVRAGAKVRAFVDLIVDLRRELTTLPLAEVLETLIAKIAYSKYLERKFPQEALDKLENVHELGAALADYEIANGGATLADWLQEVALVGSEREEDGGVCLMTFHSAKGLEFPRVYIVGLEDGLIPHTHSVEENGDLEEERRLFYVGLTRAQRKVSLSSARKRRVFKNWMANPPSRFLKEVPRELLDNGNSGSMVTKQNTFALLKGASVFHATYGRGTVRDIEADFDPIKAVVDFHDFGLRKILVSQLKLR